MMAEVAPSSSLSHGDLQLRAESVIEEFGVSNALHVSGCVTGTRMLEAVTKRPSPPFMQINGIKAFVVSDAYPR